MINALNLYRVTLVAAASASLLLVACGDGSDDITPEMVGTVGAASQETAPVAPTTLLAADPA